jgi:superfamily II DNA or RNA helicase
MKKELRGYQQACAKALHKNMTDDNRPYASVMTGLGKSLVLAALTNRYVNDGERVLQLVPRLELVEQNYQEAFNYMDKTNALGIVCGQLNKRQHSKQAVIAMSSSFVNLRAKAGSFDRLLIDECHRLAWKPIDQKPSQIQKIITSLLRINPAMKICGVTGTPYRLDQGELHETSIKALPFFTDKIYDTSIEPGIKSLIESGYLSHIETLNNGVSVDINGVKLSGDDFNKDAAGVKFDAIIDDAVEDMRNHFDDNNIQTAIIFTSNLANARHILNAWGDSSTMRIVCGDESLCTKTQRKAAIDWIKNGSGCRYILNVDILCEGFDYRALECIVLLRATTSPGLLVQMVGRVIRPHDDKLHGYLIDYGTNLERLTTGGIEDIIVPKAKKRRGDTPKKPCTAIIETPVMYEDLHYRVGDVCGYPNLLSAKKCRVCGAEFISEGEDGKYSMRTKAQALALKQTVMTYEVEVGSVIFSGEISNKTGIPMIKISLYDAESGHIANDYLCIEHTGQAKNLAIAKVMSLLVDKKSFYQISKFEGGVCVKSVLFLMGNEYYDKYFKRIKTVVITQDGRFNKVVSWGFV